MNIKIYQGHVLDEIKKIGDETVDSVITSPPYWKLRDYHLEDYIWGGDSDCDHEYGEDIEHKSTGGKSSMAELYNNNKLRYVTKSAFCTKCGAWKGQLGQEPTPELFIEHLMLLMKEIKRVLKPEGTVWINLGDTYGTQSGNTLGIKYPSLNNKEAGETIIKSNKYNKRLMLIPHRFAIACNNDGWIIRNDIIWAKQNGMPESVQDRFSKRHEHIIFMVKKEKYYFDLDAIREPILLQSKQRYKRSMMGKWVMSGDTGMGARGKDAEREFKHDGKNPGDVADFWQMTVNHKQPKHYAAYGENVIIKSILAGSPEGGLILDPFAGSGTTLVAAMKYNRNAVGIEAKMEYTDMIRHNTAKYRGDNLWGNIETTSE